MKVILIQNVQNLGKKGDIKNVAVGYATNFLIPQKLAIPATSKELERLKKSQELVESTKRAKIEELTKTAKLINGKIFELFQKADDQGNLYGSVDKKEIINLLIGEGLKVETEKINLSTPIKILGKNIIEIEITSDFKIKITIVIKKSD